MGDHIRNTTLHRINGFQVRHIPPTPAQWVLLDKNGNTLGTYSKRSELRFAAKTARLAEMCNEQAKVRGVFQPHIV